MGKQPSVVEFLFVAALALLPIGIAATVIGLLASLLPPELRDWLRLIAFLFVMIWYARKWWLAWLAHSKQTARENIKLIFDTFDPRAGRKRLISLHREG